MITPRRARPLLVVLPMLLLLAAGCADDNDDHPADPQPVPGTVIVAVDPDTVSASWTLTGPGAETWTGTGSLLLDGMDPGEYAIAWGEVAGYQKPDSTRHFLAEADTLSLVGRYAPPVATTPDILIANFSDAYSLADLGLYRSILSADFRFITKDQDEFDRDRELAITAGIFSGEAGDGGIAFRNITVDGVLPISAWEPIPANDPFFGGEPDGLWRAYDVRISFWVSGMNLILQVRGLAYFYAIPLQGQDLTSYKLLGIVDHTDGKTESFSWSSVKLLFD